MLIKQNVKIIIFSVFTLAVIIVGFVMFKRLNYNKEVFDTNIHNFIPYKAVGSVCINRKSADMFPYFGNLEPVAKTLESFITYPIFLAYYPNDASALIFKVNKEQEIGIRKQMDNTYIPFSAKNLEYKGVKIFFYPLNNNNFLGCIFHNGIFASSYNYKILEDIINATEKKNFFADKALSGLLEKISTSYTANLFVKSKDVKAGYNLTFSDNNILLDGYAIPKSVISSVHCDMSGLPGKIQIDYSILPEKITLFEIQNNTSIVSEPEACLFSVPSYKILSNPDQKYPVYCITFNKSRFRTYDAMNAIENRLTNKSLILYGSIKGTKYNLYSGSPEFSKYFFLQDSITYFTYKNKYLVFSTDKEFLIDYVTTQKGFKYMEEINVLHDTVNSFYFAKGYTTDYSYMLFPNFFNVFRGEGSISNIQTGIEDDILKIKVNINKSK